MTAPFPSGYHPFWFWNDRVTREGVVAQIAQMAEQGISGFFIHSRQGLAQPYLSEGFFELVELAITEASARGMAVHLYDEYPYPSGAAGGAVVQSDHRLAGTTLAITQRRLEGGIVRLELPAGALLVCTAVPLRGDRLEWSERIDLAPHVGMVLTRASYFDAAPQPYNDRRFFADQPRPVLETVLGDGSFELWAVSQVLVDQHKYWGSFPDVCDPAAVARFIEITHERYRARLGPLLEHVSSIFVDEVEPQASTSVLAELRRRHGPQLPDLLLAYAAPSHPEHVAALREMDAARLECFEAAFEEPVASWCRRHGLRYSGEKPSVRLRQLAYMDVPGCEPGHTKAGAARSDLLQGDIRGNARATASAAQLYGKEGSLCECYHSLGWGATLQDAKLIAESLLALGTRWLVPHAFFYSTRGLRKHDAPPSFLQMPYWPLFGELSRRVGAISAWLSGSVIDASIGVVEPSGGLPDENQRACYEVLQERLLAAQCEFLTVDTDILLAGEPAGHAWSCHGALLRAVVVPPMRDVEPALASFIARFESIGGYVARIAGEDEIDTAVRELRLRVPPSLRLEVISESGTAGGSTRFVEQHHAPPVLCACRRGPGGRLFFLVNTAAEQVAMRLVTAEDSPLEALEIGGPPPQLREDPSGGPELVLAGFESVLLTTGPGLPGGGGPPGTRGRAEEVATRSAGTVAAAPTRRSGDVQVRLPTAGAWRFECRSPNLLRLGTWRLSLAGAASGSGPDGGSLTGAGPRSGSPGRAGAPTPGAVAAVVEPAPISNQLARSGLPFAPAIGERFGLSPLLELPRMGLSYATSYACAGLGTVWLMMQRGALAGSWRLSFDSLDPVGPEAFTPFEGAFDGCVGLPVTCANPSAGAPSGGHVHHVLVEVEVDAPEQGLRDSIYVAGEFSVYAPPTDAAHGERSADLATVGVPLLASLVPQRREAELAAFETSGLPYYAGVIEYARHALFELPPHHGEVLVELEMPPGCEDAVEIAFGSGPFRPVAWSPRRVLVPAVELGGSGTEAAGSLEVRLRLSTSLARAFEGRRFDPGSHAYLEVELAPAPPSTPSS